MLTPSFNCSFVHPRKLKGLCCKRSDINLPKFRSLRADEKVPTRRGSRAKEIWITNAKIAKGRRGNYSFMFSSKELTCLCCSLVSRGSRCEFGCSVLSNWQFLCVLACKAGGKHECVVFFVVGTARREACGSGGRRRCRPTRVGRRYSKCLPYFIVYSWLI